MTIDMSKASAANYAACCPCDVLAIVGLITVEFEEGEGL